MRETTTIFEVAERMGDERVMWALTNRLAGIHRRPFGGAKPWSYLVVVDAYRAVHVRAELEKDSASLLRSGGEPAADNLLRRPAEDPEQQLLRAKLFEDS